MIGRMFPLTFKQKLARLKSVLKRTRSRGDRDTKIWNLYMKASPEEKKLILQAYPAIMKRLLMGFGER